MSTLTEQVKNLFIATGSERDTDENLSLTKALFYTINKAGSHRFVFSAGDIYDGLEELGDKFVLGTNEVAIAIETTGWAAPIEGNEDEDEDEMVAPSQHPKRRRVRLMSIVTRSYEVASALGFADDDEIVTDSGTARGSLAEALLHTMKQIVSKSN